MTSDLFLSNHLTFIDTVQIHLHTPLNNNKKIQSVLNSESGCLSLLNFQESSLAPDGSGTREGKAFLQGLDAQSPV